MHGPKFVKHPISTPFNGDKPRILPCFSKNEPLPRRYRMGSFFVAGCFFCDFRDICLFGDPSFPSTKVQQLFERSEFLIPTRGTSQKKNPSVCGCVCWTNLGFSVEKIVLVLVWGTSERLVPAKKKKRTPGTSEHFVANCGVGPSTRGQGDSASLVQRR